MQPTMTEIAAVLNKAADHLEAVGLHQRGLFNQYDHNAPDGRPVRCCAMGALCVATGLYTTRGDVSRAADGGLYNAAADALLRYLGLSIPRWNDSEGQTASCVAGTMRSAARKLVRA